MATRRSQLKLRKSQRLEQNSQESSSSGLKSGASDDGDDSENMVVIKSEPESNEDSSGGSGRGSPSHMSLDVLAQVATETLRREPARQTPKKISKRSVQSLDVLSLEQIRMLSDRALINMFAELSGDELKRQYTYQCFLVPAKCKETFSSFGNENRARLQMKHHLLSHLGELLRESNGPSRKAKFTAEPIQARRKRMAAEVAAQKKAQKRARQSHNRRVGSFTVVRSPGRKRMISTGAESATDREDEEYGAGSKRHKAVISDQPGNGKKARNVRLSQKQLVGGVTIPAGGKARKNKESDDGSDIDVECVASSSGTSVDRSENTATAADKRIEENEKFIVDLLARNQPYHDHSYTTVFGKRKGIETLHLELDSEDLTDEQASRTTGIRAKIQVGDPEREMANQSKTVTLKVNAGMVPTVNNVHIPIIRLARIPVAPDGTPLVSAEEVVVEGGTDDKRTCTSAARPYPPMPKSDLARKGKVVVPEEEMSSSGDEGPLPVVQPIRRGGKKLLSEGSAEWERKLALKCIRELRCKKKEETSLVCKICKDKAFTATATLMYHYRSHAGIKPFVCLICNTTFTRQHSLNYHMLIHNNQSRFTCKDCGRKFRHPSHFKEHLRRHTGETPFHCSDCPLRFKTRNTYKRHLKTRHGKLLTAEGIRMMEAAEIVKFRTKRYRRSDDGDYEGNVYVEDEEDDDDEDEEDYEDMDEDEDSREGVTTAHDMDPPNRLLQFCTQVVGQENA